MSLVELVRSQHVLINKLFATINDSERDSSDSDSESLKSHIMLHDLAMLKRSNKKILSLLEDGFDYRLCCKKRVWAKHFEKRPTYDELVKMAARIKNKPVRYFYFLENGKQYRIHTNEELKEMEQTNENIEIDYLHVKFKF